MFLIGSKDCIKIIFIFYRISEKLTVKILFLGYLAPELLQKRPHGLPADFWSIGVFLFELLSCKSPFRRHTVRMGVLHISYPCTLQSDYLLNVVFI